MPSSPRGSGGVKLFGDLMICHAIANRRGWRRSPSSDSACGQETVCLDNIIPVQSVGPLVPGNLTPTACAVPAATGWFCQCGVAHFDNLIWPTLSKSPRHWVFDCTLRWFKALLLRSSPLQPIGTAVAANGSTTSFRQIRDTRDIRTLDGWLNVGLLDFQRPVWSTLEDGYGRMQTSSRIL